MLIQVAISNSPLYDTYTYMTDSPVEPGERVEVNFSGRNTVGYVVSLEGKTGRYRIKSINKRLDGRPFLSSKDLELAEFVMKEYIAPPGKVFDLFFPPGKLLSVDDFVVPLSDELGFSPTKKDKFIKQYGEEKLTELLSLRDVKIMHSFERRTPKKRKIRRISLSLKTDLLKQNLTPLWQTIVDYLLSVESAEVSELEKKLQLKSRSPIETLISKGILTEEETEEDDSHWVIPAVTELNGKQKEVYKSIMESGSKAFLLHGLTGTGKTEVYFKVMEYLLNKGKQILYLVPEVSLTPQLLARIRGAFPGRDVRQYHSYMAKGLRQQIWLDAVEGNVDILVGTRSSLWVPMKNTGLIVVDEEHDTSFYQQSVPYYDGVEAAMKKAELLNVPIILGSATPRVSHYHLTESGKLILLSLTERPVGSFPIIELIDMKEEKNPIISKRALEEIKKTISAGKQVFVFVHRKGYSNYVVCFTCGNTITCPHCSVSMTYHKADNSLKCHYCGYKEPIPKTCPSCGSMTLSARGFGTERVEHDLQKYFPSAKIMRMDRETIDNPMAYEKALLEISKKESQIIVGTKMITKGLDFPDVEMVLVVDADRLMSFPSYDSSETAFQHISQVSGRSGRAGIGKAFIQSFNPKNRIIKAAFERDYETFYKDEIALRKELNNPPFAKIAEIICYGDTEDKSGELAERILSEVKAERLDTIEVFGPLTPLLSKLKNSYRMKITIKLPSDSDCGFLEKIQKRHPADVQIIINGIGGII